MDIFKLLFGFIIIFSDFSVMSASKESTLRLMAALGIFMIWMKFLDNLRAFSLSSFYVKLIIETIKDMTPFLTFFVTAILTSSVMIYILLKNRYERGMLEMDDFFSDRGGNSYTLANLIIA